MKTRAFTLLELLITVSIVSVLAALTIVAVNKARRSAALGREVNGGKQAVAAYLRYASDHDGDLMVGYSANEGATDDLGKEVPNPACGRYPWRLAPYLDYKILGTLLVNEQEEIAKRRERDDYVYRASAHPSFGMNATYVGGNERTGLMPTPATINRFGNFVAMRLNHVALPGKLMVFASARFTDTSRSGQRQENDHIAGFHLLTPPRTTKVEWKGAYAEDGDAKEFGMLHLRYGGRAVCAFLGGNVELLDATQLQDMRYWSAQAAEENNENFQIRPIR